MCVPNAYFIVSSFDLVFVMQIAYLIKAEYFVICALSFGPSDYKHSLFKMLQSSLSADMTGCS
jgi:hypothetical protein